MSNLEEFLFMYECWLRNQGGDKVEIPKSDAFRLVDAARAGIQPDLFRDLEPVQEPDLTPRTHDAPTSIRAAAKAAPKAKGRALRLVRAIDEAPNGLIRDQACNVAGVLPQSACGILNVLEDQGYLMSNGVRPNQHGNDCKVYFVTEKGKRWLI